MAKPTALPPAETIDIADARRAWDAVLERVRTTGTRVVIAEGGEPIAALVPAADVRRLAMPNADPPDELMGLQDILRTAFSDLPKEEVDRQINEAVTAVTAGRSVRAILDEIGAAFADVSAEEIEQEAAKAIAEVRAENRERRGPVTAVSS